MSETKTKNLCTVPAADLTDNQYFIAEDGGELKRIPKAQVVLKKLEKMLATDTENLAGGGEVTAQKLLDVLAEQVANKLLAKSQVVNNLLATVEGNPLDATQGKALKDLIDTTNNNLSQKLNGRNVKWFPEGESLATIITESVEVSTYGITPKSCPSEIISGGFGYGTLITAGGRGNQGYGYGFAIYAGTNTAGTRVFATYDKDGGWSERVSKSDLNTVLMYRGVIAGDLNRGRNLAIAPGIYSIQSASTITNGTSDFVGWGIFVQFPDNLFSQMILNSTNYIKFRKYSGSNPSWSAW